MTDRKAAILALFTFTPHWCELPGRRITPERPVLFDSFYVKVSLDMAVERANAALFESLLDDNLDMSWGPHALARILTDRALEIARQHEDAPLLKLDDLTGEDRCNAVLCGGPDWHLNFQRGHIGEVMTFVSFPTKVRAKREAAKASI